MVEILKLTPLQDWKKRLEGLEPLFASLVPDPSWTDKDGVQAAYKRVMKTLDADRRRLQDEGGFIFSVKTDPDDLTSRNIDMMRGWYLRGSAPSLVALTILAMDYFRPQLPDDLLNGILVAGILAEVPCDLPYHNNMHYKKVLLQSIRLAAVHNDIYEGTMRAMDDAQMGLLLLAACIHDLGHDGHGNTVKGNYVQGRLERRSLSLALPYLESCGMNNSAQMEALKVMFLCTDVSPIGDPASYASQMKAAYRYHFLGTKKKLPQLNLDRDLAVLEVNADLTTMALLLHEADIATSAGLDYDVTCFETALYKREIGDVSASPQDIVDFLKDVCHQRMLSDAGQALYAANMARIFALAETDIKEGVRRLPAVEQSEFLTSGEDGDKGSPSKTIN